MTGSAGQCPARRSGDWAAGTGGAGPAVAPRESAARPSPDAAAGDGERERRGNDVRQKVSLRVRREILIRVSIVVRLSSRTGGEGGAAGGQFNQCPCVGAGDTRTSRSGVCLHRVSE